MGDHLQDLAGGTRLSQAEHRGFRRDNLWSSRGDGPSVPPAEAREEVRAAMSGLLSVSSEIAGWKFLVQEGELMIYEPGHEGDSEPVTWNTCRKLLLILRASVYWAARNRDQ